MTEKLDNPPAFPIPELRGSDGCGIMEGSPGMSLLDHFAGQALIGMLANADSAGLRPDLVAADCYTYARAMLAERAKWEG